MQKKRNLPTHSKDNRIQATENQFPEIHVCISFVFIINVVLYMSVWENFDFFFFYFGTF